MINKPIFRLFLLTLLLFQIVSSKAQILEPVKWTFTIENETATDATLVFTAKVDKGWHVYSQYVPEGGPVPTSFSIKPSNDFKVVGKVTEQKQHFYEKVIGNRKAKVNVFVLVVLFVAALPLIRDYWGYAAYLLVMFPVGASAYYLRKGFYSYIFLALSLYSISYEYFTGMDFFGFLLIYSIWVALIALVLKYIGNNKRLLELYDNEANLRTRAERNNARYEKALQASQGRIRMFLENSTSGFYRSTPEGKLIDANPALQKILGYKTKERLMTIDLQSCYDNPKDREVFKERIERDGSIIQSDGMWRREDLSTVYVRESAWGVRDYSGKTIFYEGIVEDLTENFNSDKTIRSLADELATERSEKQSYIESLERSQTLSFELVDKSPIATLIVNSAGTIQYANNSFLSIAESDKDRIEGKNFLDFVCQSDRATIADAIASGALPEFPSAPIKAKIENLGLAEYSMDVFVAPINSDSKGNKKIFLTKPTASEGAEELEKTIFELRSALKESKHIGELLPICASCKSIRGEDGSWMSIEEYIDSRSNTQFSHGICPECARKLYPDFYGNE